MKDDITCLRCTERMQCRRYVKWLDDIGNFHVPRVNGCAGYKEDREYTLYLEAHMKEKEQKSKC